jgi:hypothetical protein
LGEMWKAQCNSGPYSESSCILLALHSEYMSSRTLFGAKWV